MGISVIALAFNLTDAKPQLLDHHLDEKH